MSKRKRVRKYEVNYQHGLDDETLKELTKKSNLTLLDSVGGDLSNTGYLTRRMLRNEGLIKTNTRATKRGDLRLEFTKKALALMKELEKGK